MTYLEDQNINLNKELIPKWRKLLNKQLNKKKKTPYFSKGKMELLEIALKEHGDKIAPNYRERKCE